MKNERTHIFCEFCDAHGADDPWHSPEDMEIEFTDDGNQVVKCQYEWQFIDLNKIWGEEETINYEDMYPVW